MSGAFFREGIAQHLRLTHWLAGQEALFERMARILIEGLEAGRRIYLMGNGGSAADAQHIAAELVGRFKADRRALPAVALTTDTSGLLSIGNDFGFEQVFARQVEALVEPGDVIWALSASGRSPNIIAAVRAARLRGARVIGFTGRGGGELRELCDACLCVDHETTDRIQEIHELAYHLLCEAVDRHFARKLP